MPVAVRITGDVTIVDVSGRLMTADGDYALLWAVGEALGRGARKLLLNFADVTTIDSAGIGAMVSAYSNASQHEGRLKLLNLPPPIHDFMRITQLVNLFEVWDDEAEAVDSFRPFRAAL